MNLFKRRDFFLKSLIGLIGTGFLLSSKKQFKDKIENITTGYRGILVDEYNF